MALVAKNGKPTLSSLNPPQGHCDPQTADEDIEAGDACRITATGVVRSVGAEEIDGYAMKDASDGEPVTLLHDERMDYGTGLAPGTSLFLDGALPGRLNTTRGAGLNAVPAARVIDGKRIQVLQRFATA